MDAVSISALVLSAVSLVVSAISPLVVAAAYFIQHIKSSQCCGGKAELYQDPPKDKG